MLEIEGDFVQTADGSLLLEIGGTDPGDEFDVLQVGGIADLAGDLAVVLIDGFQPTLGDSFGILDFGSLSPSSTGFDTVSLPVLAAGLAWDESALYGSGSLLVVALPEPGCRRFIGPGLEWVGADWQAPQGRHAPGISGGRRHLSRSTWRTFEAVYDADQVLREMIKAGSDS